jgi:integrase
MAKTELTDRQIRAARPREKPYRLPAGRGLYVEVTPGGSKLWRYKYRYGGKEKRLALGEYPAVGLSEARKRHAQAWAAVKDGRDPAAERKAAKVARIVVASADANTFEAVAEAWFAEHMASRSADHRATVESRLEKRIYPWIGGKPIDAVTVDEVRATIKRIAETAPEVARRMLQVCSQVFRYAVVHGLAESDPAGALRGLVKPQEIRHHASLIDPRAVGELLLAIDGYQGQFTTRCALKLAPLLFVRPGELRRAEWAEFNLEAAEWRIPAEKMKAREPHIVPLSGQALAILEELHPLTGAGKYLFPAVRTASRPMSDNTVNAALRRLGYSKEQMTGHGFRSIASTFLNEQGWKGDVIERQLAHGERDKVRAAYNYASHMKDRKEMMQAWADHLDSLRAQAKAGNVVQFRQKA